MMRIIRVIKIAIRVAKPLLVMAKIKYKKIELDRKILSQIAIEDPQAFDEIVKKVAG